MIYVWYLFTDVWPHTWTNLVSYTHSHAAGGVKARHDHITETRLPAWIWQPLAWSLSARSVWWSHRTVPSGRHQASQQQRCAPCSLIEGCRHQQRTCGPSTEGHSAGRSGPVGVWPACRTVWSCQTAAGQTDVRDAQTDGAVAAQTDRLTNLDAFERGHSHVEEDSVEDGHRDELKDGSKDINLKLEGNIKTSDTIIPNIDAGRMFILACWVHARLSTWSHTNTRVIPKNKSWSPTGQLRSSTGKKKMFYFSKH